MTTVDPRTLGYASLILGVVFVVVGLFDLTALGQPVHISSPIPGFANWMMSTFGHTGVRVIQVVFWFAFGFLFLRHGWRALRPTEGN
jgi:hypothetical protein